MTDLTLYSIILHSQYQFTMFQYYSRLRFDFEFRLWELTWKKSGNEEFVIFRFLQSVTAWIYMET